MNVSGITRSGLCLGCGLCAGTSRSGAIRMRLDESGFYRPVEYAPVPEAERKHVLEVCPGLNIEHSRKQGEAPYDPRWGPLLATMLAWSSDPEARFRGSSGGALSEFIAYLIDSGEVDYVLQTATAAEAPLLNETVTSVSRCHVLRAAGSRYSPSSPLADINKHLDGPGRFAFVGKPCDVAGLRRLALRDSRVREKVPMMIAFMCAGLPSLKGTTALLKKMGIEDPRRVESFQYRGNGWPGFARAILDDGQEVRMDYETSWGGVLNKHLQFRCKICPDGIGEFADITFGDAWYLDSLNKPIFEEREGRSLVMVRTSRGSRLFAAAASEGRIFVVPQKIEVVEFMQRHQATRKGLIISRLAAMATLGRKLPRYRRLSLWKMACQRSLFLNIKNYLGMLRRILTNSDAA